MSDVKRDDFVESLIKALQVYVVDGTRKKNLDSSTSASGIIPSDDKKNEGQFQSWLIMKTFEKGKLSYFRQKL